MFWRKIRREQKLSQKNAKNIIINKNDRSRDGKINNFPNKNIANSIETY